MTLYAISCMYKGEKKTLHNTTAEQDPCRAGKTVKEELEQTYRYTRLDDDSPLCSVHFLASRSHLELHGHEKHRKKASHARIPVVVFVASTALCPFSTPLLPLLLPLPLLCAPSAAAAVATVLPLSVLHDGIVRLM